MGSSKCRWPQLLESFSESACLQLGRTGSRAPTVEVSVSPGPLSESALRRILVKVSAFFPAPHYVPALLLSLQDAGQKTSQWLGLGAMKVTLDAGGFGRVTLLQAPLARPAAQSDRLAHWRRLQLVLAQDEEAYPEGLPLPVENSRALHHYRRR